MDEINPPPFDESFLLWAEKLNDDKSNDNDFLDFISYYGTHFMKTVTFGARYTFFCTISND